MADVDHDREAEKTSAAEIVGSVDDLLLQILRRVPPENIDRNNLLFKLASKHLKTVVSEYWSRIRLRFVSRHWNSLISNNYRRPNPKPFPAAGLIFECGPTSKHSYYILLFNQSISNTTATFRKLNPVDDPWHSHSKVVHSCNGLLLCASSQRDYSVCNPTTGKHSTLPRVPPPNSKKIRGAYLAFDPCKSPHYKVVCVLGLEFVFQFVVYSSETGCWGKRRGELLKTNVAVGFSFRNNNRVYWNGAIHWVDSSQLVCFNPDRLAPPTVMPMPIAHCLYHRFYFGESYGHLHYIDLGIVEFVVHEMSSDYSGWAVKYKLHATDPGPSLCHNVYAVVRGERDEDMFLVLGTGSWWNNRMRRITWLNHNTHETIYDFSNNQQPLENPWEFTSSFQYIESLASA